MSMILEQLINAGPVAFRGQLAQQVDAVVAETSNQLVRFNTTTDQTVRRSAMQHILGYPLPAETVINPPFQTDFGPHTKLVGTSLSTEIACSLTWVASPLTTML